MDLARIRHAFSLKANLRSLWLRPSDRYAAVDGLRALSMLWVVLTHLCLALSRGISYDAYVATMDRLPWLYVWVLHGEKALDSFFLISGFLIGSMLLAEHRKTGGIRLGRFFARRYLRLMPAYAVALAVLWVSGAEGPVKARTVWANILYVNNFLPQARMFMDVSWSLAVEEQFYVCLPFFLVGLFFRARRPWVPLTVLFVLSFAVRAIVLGLHPGLTRVGLWEHFVPTAPHYSSEYFDAIYVNLYTRFGPFVLGLALAWIGTAHEDRLRALLARHPRLGDALLVLGVATLVGLIAVPAFDPHVAIPHALLWLYVLAHRNVWSIGILLVMVAVLHPTSALTSAVRRALGARIWFPIAQLSYCSYLFHLAFIRPGLLVSHALLHRTEAFDAYLTVLGGPDLLVAYVVTMALSFAWGAVLYLGVERPLLDLRPR
jgi:peptidoglycan/LPS O-acetylase OafA/YrhL